MEKDIYKLDSIEEGIAAMENPEGMMLYFDSDRLPEDTKSGDCFTFENGVFVFQKEETENRREAISDLLDGLLSKK